MHLQVPVRQGQAQARLQLQPLAGGLGHGFFIEAPGAPTLGFGAIDRRVRALQQQLGRGRMLGKHADTHADTRHHLKTVGRAPGLGHGTDELARHGGGAIGMTQVTSHHGQLIPGQPAQHVTRPQGRLHLLDHVLEHLVPRGMAIAVVHILETVQVEQEHRHALTADAGLFHGLFQLVAKPGAVVQTGERIVARQVLQLPHPGFFLGDIGEHAHVVRDGTLQVAHGGQRHVLGEDFATLAAVPYLALPMPRAPHDVPHGVVESLVVPSRLEDARGLTQQFVLGVAQKPRHRRIGRQDAALRIGDQHALERVVHHGVRQPLAGFAALQGSPGCLDLVQVLHHAHQVRGLIARVRHQGHGAQHRHLAAIVLPLAFAFVHIVVDLARQQPIELRQSPLAIRSHQHVAEIEAGHVLERHPQQGAQARVGPQKPAADLHAGHPGGCVAHDL